MFKGLRRSALVFGVSALALTSLASCSSGSGGTRTIEVDYHADEFAGVFASYFPRTVTVKPGMTLKFHQTWTGEPHSVTFGKVIDDNIQPVRKLLADIAALKVPIPDEAPEGYNEELFDHTLPSLFSESDELGQDAALPCYAPKKSDLPLDHKACAKKLRTQPEFNGKLAYYSSGFIPFEGDRGNTFEMKIADDTKDGTYFYYCNVHGVLMSGEITVQKDAKVESQADINRRGQAEADKYIAKLNKVYEKEKAGKSEQPLPLAGSGDESTDSIFAGVNEFTPRTIEAKVNDPVTWTFVGDHTISFNVPPYSPIFRFDKKGNLGFNESLDKAAGGWPGFPEEEPAEGAPPEEHGPDDSAPPRAPVKVDAGKWDGSGKLHSSGTGWDTGDQYTVTFTKAGTYPYACLIHPGMIGKVVVK